VPLFENLFDLDLTADDTELVPPEDQTSLNRGFVNFHIANSVPSSKEVLSWKFNHG